MKRRASLAWLPALALLLATRASGAAPAPTLDGAWRGTLEIGRGHGTSAAVATLTQSGGVVRGTITLAGSDASGTVTVSGTVQRTHARLAGQLGGRHVRWKARWASGKKAWRGPVVVQGRGHGMHGMLGFARGDGGTLPACGADFFASDVMPAVFATNCVQCHVAGGLAQNTRLRVTPGDPAATALSALGLVDPADPLHSLLLLKPSGQVSHGGGQRFLPGSAADQALRHWIDLVTTPGCGGAGGGGGGGGSGGGTGDPYTDNCASCHGADARGGQGYPDIHCSRSIQDAVRNGRTGGALTMPAFPSMSDADLASIQTFLAGLCSASAVTGADLFSGNCLSCHGVDAGGSATAPAVRCATRVADALMRGRGVAMPGFTAFVDPEVALLEVYLDGLCTQHGRTAADLYAGNCVTCHGADGRGARSGLGVQGPDIRCDRAIHDPVRAGNGDMLAFPGLSDADIASVQGYLGASFCPAGTATGADLWAGNCARCHGGDARGVNGNPNVRCNRSIHDVVRGGRTGTVGTMPAFTAMSDAEIALVQGYLVGLCPAGTASGPDLYAGNCLTCHGTDAGGSASAPGVRCATRVPDALARGRGAAMPAFTGFPGADLTTLDAYLDQLCTQYGRTGMDLYAGNCSTCHGATARGGRNGLGVRGPDIACTGANDYLDAVRSGDDGMPAFPLLGTSDVSAIAGFVRGAYCPGG